MRRAALIALVLAGCGGGAARPAPTAPAPAASASTSTDATPATAASPPAADPAAALPARVEALIGGYEAIARAVGPGVRCPQVAATIEEIAGSTAGARADVRTASRGERAAELDGLMTAAEPRLAPALAAIDEAATRCAGEPAVARALAELDR